MKKNLLIFMMLIASFSFVSCASTKADAEVSTSKTVSQDGGVPEWFYNTPVSEDLHYAAGSALSTDKQIAIKKAEMVARNLLAEWIETNVKEVLKNYVNDAGDGGYHQIMDAFESISVQVATASLKGVTREKVQFNDDGYVYVLMSIPNANVEKAFEPATKAVADTIAQSEAADLANERMQSAFEDLLNGKL